MKHITPCLWFDDNAEEAARFYTSIFPNSKIKHIGHYGEAAAAASGRPLGSVLTVLFDLNGQEHMALNGGPIFKFSEAVSLMVMCESQAEVDHFWNALCGPGSGGEESQCGWLKDRFGLSWQIVPVVFMQMMQDRDPRKVERVMKAMLTMRKFDIAVLQRAYSTS
jgi:predicted 3-demethylubiquinone-9 3-methyltransferase (glyoxalase superfamily)